jgi:hypothetical protein
VAVAKTITKDKNARRESGPRAPAVSAAAGPARSPGCCGVAPGTTDPGVSLAATIGLYPVAPRYARSARDRREIGRSVDSQRELIAYACPPAASLEAMREMSAHARELLEAEICALRAQVIALGGDPDAAAPTAARPLEPSAAARRQSGVSGSTDTLSVDDSVELTSSDNGLPGVDLGDLDLLPKLEETDASGQQKAGGRTDLGCPYCENAASVGGNQSKRPRKDNCIGTWWVVHD